MDQYPNPPLIEVVCEIFFISNKPWSPTVPGQFLSKVKSKFPILETKPSGFGIAMGPGGVSVLPQSSDPVTQFFNNEKDIVIQVAPNLLSVNKLKPYKGWNHLKPIFYDNIRHYQKISSPDGVNRLGLKYINKIEIEEHSYENIKKLLNYYPLFPEAIEQHANSINLITEIPIIKGKEVLAISLATLLPDGQMKAPALLEISYLMIKPSGIELKDVNKWYANAHTKIKKTFESIITEECRKKFY